MLDDARDETFTRRVCWRIDLDAGARGKMPTSQTGAGARAR